MIEFEPPRVRASSAAISVSRSARPAKRDRHSGAQIGAQSDQVSNSSGRTVDNLKRRGLTRLPATRVKPPLIAECFANLECKVTDRRLVKDYNLSSSSAEGLDRSGAEEAEDHSSLRLRQVRGRRAELHAAIAHALN
jgi:flavin reductase (DIM6/NTAB) family NADH-FMN oxidoreductase RutF